MVIAILVGFAIISVITVVVLMVLMIVKPEIFSKNKNKDGEIISEEMTHGVNKGNELNGGMAKVLGDTKRFVPVSALDNYSIDLGNYNYRAIIEVSSINYSLLNEMEQEMVEQGYHKFLNSLDFPVEIYIQTRELDMDLVIENLDKNIASTRKKFPSAMNYATLYRQQLGDVTRYINNSKIKKKFLIITYNNTELKNVSNLRASEIKELAIDILMNRCNIVMSGITGIGLRATLLNKADLAECLYAYYHRNSQRIARDMAVGMFDSLVINGNKDKNITDRMKLDLILNDCQNRIKGELINADSSEEEIKFYNYIYSVLEEFKQDDRSMSMGDIIRGNYDSVVNAGYEDGFVNYIENNPDAMDYTNFDEPEVTESGYISIRMPEGGFDNTQFSNLNQQQYYSNQYQQPQDQSVFMPQFAESNNINTENKPGITFSPYQYNG